MKSSFSISELQFRNGSDAEQIRTRKIFEKLQLKAKANKKLTEHEKDFFCQALMFSLRNDGSLDDFNCCDNRKFKFLYLTHYHDLSGTSPVYKPNNAQQKVTQISEEEKQNDLEYLYAKSAEWKVIITKLNHKELLLQEAAKEARNDLNNNHDSLQGNSSTIISNSNFTNEEIEMEILLKSKYIYCIALKLFEKLSKDDLLLKINGQNIEINEFSIIHILNRHFASKNIYYDTKKSFHIEDFEPELLHNQLREIFEKIDHSETYKNFSLDKIAFQFKGVDYQIWT